MKKLLLLFVLTPALIFCGCSKEESNAPKEKEITLPGYDEPSIEWGISQEELIASLPYNLDSQDARTLTFDGKDMVTIYMYLFENNQLDASSAVVPSKYSMVLAEFLAEKYIPTSIDEANYRFYFCNAERTLNVGMQISLENILVIYYPWESTASLNTMFSKSQTQTLPQDEERLSEKFEQLRSFINNR